MTEAINARNILAVHQEMEFLRNQMQMVLRRLDEANATAASAIARIMELESALGLVRAKLLGRGPSA